MLAGQRLGIKQGDAGIWLVSFMDYDLGYFDLEQRTLQPRDNPFGPKLRLIKRRALKVRGIERRALKLRPIERRA